MAEREAPGREAPGGDPEGSKEGPATIDFDGLYRRHAPHVYRFALYLSGDRSTAEDIVSETFVRVWGARDRLVFSSVRAYLITIARNEYLQLLRRRRREAELDPALDCRDAAPLADEQRRAREELHRVMRGLRALPEATRAAVLMRSEEGLSYEDIATALGVSSGAARVMVHRGRARLAAARKE